MAVQTIFAFLKKHPNLREAFSKGRILTGYTNGSQEGKQVSVFVFRTSWSQFCISALSKSVLLSGKVLLVSESEDLDPNGNWEAYSLEL